VILPHGDVWASKPTSPVHAVSYKGSWDMYDKDSNTATPSEGATHVGVDRDGRPLLLVDEPRPGVRRFTMNRPEKRNSLIHPLRGAILEALRAGDQDSSVSVMIIRGAGPSFSAGYDLAGGNEGYDMPYYTPGGEGAWPRHVTEGWMSIWDLAKPVIAQVHGYCLAGGSELATGCDLIYVAEDAKMGYPAVRFGVPDMHFHAWFLGMRRAMEMMVTGDSISGIEAVAEGWANRAFPADELDDAVLEIASRIATLPPEVVQLNKRVVHRQMDQMGMRAGLRAGTELCALGTHTHALQQFIADARDKGLTNALQVRDAPFGDYRTVESH
jgi:enoyl-CoA hydratase